MLPLAGIHPGILVELGNFSCDVNRQVRRIEERNAFYAGFAGEHGAAEGFFAEPIRADYTHSGYDDAREHRSIRISIQPSAYCLQPAFRSSLNQDGGFRGML